MEKGGSPYSHFMSCCTQKRDVGALGRAVRPAFYDLAKCTHQFNCFCSWQAQLYSSSALWLGGLLMSIVTAVLALHCRARGSFGPSTPYPSPQTPGMHAYSPMLSSEASHGGTPPSFSPQPAFRQTAFQQVPRTPDSSCLPYIEITPVSLTHSWKPRTKPSWGLL